MSVASICLFASSKQARTIEAGKREAVQQDNRRAAAQLGVVLTDSIGLNRVMANFSHGPLLVVHPTIPN